jgi:23S rRNA A2030 N6-methylase RlmJ
MPKPIEVVNQDKRSSETIRVYNKSPQLISLQVRPPNSDFYINEQQVHLHPKKSAILPKDYVIEEQLSNLQARGFVQVIAGE